MPVKKNSKTSISKLRGETFFNLAVARGGSYLVSTVGAEGRCRQLQDSVNEFVKQFGGAELHYFLEELENWLAARGYDVCVADVAYFRQHGAPPPVPVAAPKSTRVKTKPVTSRAANVRKVSRAEETLESGYAEVA
jgi:hypothetical protein